MAFFFRLYVSFREGNHHETAKISSWTISTRSQSLIKVWTAESKGTVHSTITLQLWAQPSGNHLRCGLCLYCMRVVGTSFHCSVVWCRWLLHLWARTTHLIFYWATLEKLLWRSKMCWSHGNRSFGILLLKRKDKWADCQGKLHSQERAPYRTLRCKI